MKSIGRYKIWERISVLKRHLHLYSNPYSIKKLARVPFIEWAMRTRKASSCPMPIMVKVEPTNICNLKCDGCYSNHNISWTGETEPERPKGMMEFDTFRKIVDQLGDSLYKISLYGQGEPLLNREVYKMVRHAADRRISCVISTNFNVVKNGAMDKLLDCGLEHLIVALDTLDPKIYSSYRVGGDLKVVKANLEEFIKLKRARNKKFPIVEVQSIIREENRDEIAKLDEYAKRIGADRFSAKMDSNYLKTIPMEERGIKPCYWLWYSASFNWDGSVSPCGCALVSSKFMYGNINKQNFREIWNSEQYQNSRRLFVNGKTPEISHIKECYTCPIFPNNHHRKFLLSEAK